MALGGTLDGRTSFALALLNNNNIPGQRCTGSLYCHHSLVHLVDFGY